MPSSLPPELLNVIFSFLSTKDLRALSTTCHRFRQITLQMLYHSVTLLVESENYHPSNLTESAEPRKTVSMHNGRTFQEQNRSSFDNLVDTEIAGAVRKCLIDGMGFGMPIDPVRGWKSTTELSTKMLGMVSESLPAIHTLILRQVTLGEGVWKWLTKYLSSSNIQSLHISHCVVNLGDTPFSKLSWQCDTPLRLKDLTVTSCSIPPQPLATLMSPQTLTSLKLSRVCGNNLPLLYLPHLRSLTIDFSIHDISNISTFFEGCPNIRELYLRGPSSYSSKQELVFGLRLPLNALKYLEVIEGTWCTLAELGFELNGKPRSNITRLITRPETSLNGIFVEEARAASVLGKFACDATSNVETLELEMASLTPDIVESICALKGLKELSMKICDSSGPLNQTPMEMIDIFARCSLKISPVLETFRLRAGRGCSSLRMTGVGPLIRSFTTSARKSLGRTSPDIMPESEELTKVRSLMSHCRRLRVVNVSSTNARNEGQIYRSSCRCSIGGRARCRRIDNCTRPKVDKLKQN